MKRFHVHLGVPDLAASIRFYSNLFGRPPAIEKPDYAKWMLDDPRVNFAVSQRTSNAGLSHLGLEAESASELAQIRASFAAADPSLLVDEPNARCCYAEGNKHWTRDPQGIAWEGFQTTATLASAAQCCAPQVAPSTTERQAAKCC
ncbi:MAG TPA: VOC family protein [Casimicrobiaceae bacterium]|nr:VOC family protein [Casimicrobiaceae bacterium]